ncbi:MAG: hypothetical protein NT118_07585 [Lentisphaerae bacterium]|nr:hypothetical protein [Lentisphaerota bacterium]
MKKTGLFLFSVILIGAALLAACGQAPAPNANPGAPATAPLAPAGSNPTTANSNPLSGGNCTLLSKDEVGTILGEAVVEVRDPAKDGTTCVYQTKSLILELNSLHNFGGFVDSVNFMKETRAANINNPTEDVPGLGEDAFYNGNLKYNMLYVSKGGIVYTFGVRNVTTDQSLSSPDNAQAMEKAIAVLLLSRLP